MSDKNSLLLPHILETLSQKPELCKFNLNYFWVYFCKLIVFFNLNLTSGDTYENLCDEIEYVLSSENLAKNSGNVKKALQNALDVGQNLGIITLTDDLVRMPFNMAKVPNKNVPMAKKVRHNWFIYII